MGVIRSLLSQCKRLRKVCGKKYEKERYVGGKVLKFKPKKVGVKKMSKIKQRKKQAISSLKNDDDAQVISDLNCVRFYSSSLLVIYEGSGDEEEETEQPR